MGIKQIYRNTGEGAVASYDFTEIANGLGIVDFNGFSTNSGGVESFHLTNGSPFSNLVDTSGSLTGAAGTTLEFDFDSSPFNLPRSIRGDTSVVLSWKVTNNTSSNSNFVYATLNKLDGTTETLLSTTSGAILDSGIGARTNTLSFNGVPKTHFKKGEQVRLTVGIQVVTAGNDPKRGFFAFDPQNRDGFNISPSTDSSSTSKLIMSLPFDIDL